MVPACNLTSSGSQQEVINEDFVLVLIATVSGAAQQSTPQTHHGSVDQRGAHVMGFDQSKTTHHFVLYEDGGVIEVSVKDAANTTDLNAIRGHLPHIAKMFGAGNFEAPMLVHDTNVPGTADMAKMKIPPDLPVCRDGERRQGRHHDDRSGCPGRGAQIPSLSDFRSPHRRLDDRQQAMSRPTRSVRARSPERPA